MTRMFIAPLKAVRDYEAARDRLEELEEATERDEALADESEDEIEALDLLIEDFESREGVSDDDDDDFEIVGALDPPEPEEIAAFSLSNGNALRFLAAPHSSEVFVGERAAEGCEDLVIGDRISPVALYARLAGEKAAVPRALARLDETGLFEARKVVDALPAEVGVDLAQMSGLFLPSTMGQQGSCQSDPAGRSYFISHHCGSSGGPGYGKSESHCYPNASSWIQKTSGGRRRATWSRMAACGSSSCRMLHQYKRARGWRTQLTVHMSPPVVEGWWSYKKGIRRFRRVRFERLGSNAIVRGYVKYHSQVAEWS